MRFIDEVRITVISGNGGPGKVSFRREKSIEQMKVLTPSFTLEERKFLKLKMANLALEDN
jgi:hypothetical protein